MWSRGGDGEKLSPPTLFGKGPGSSWLLMPVTLLLMAVSLSGLSSPRPRDRPAWTLSLRQTMLVQIPSAELSGLHPIGKLYAALLSTECMHGLGSITRTQPWQSTFSKNYSPYFLHQGTASHSAAISHSQTVASQLGGDCVLTLRLVINRALGCYR